MAEDEYLIRKITSKDFDKICRLCMEEGKLLSSIAGTLVEDLDVSFLLQYSISLEVVLIFV